MTNTRKSTNIRAPYNIKLFAKIRQFSRGNRNGKIMRVVSCNDETEFFQTERFEKPLD